MLLVLYLTHVNSVIAVAKTFTLDGRLHLPIAVVKDDLSDAKLTTWQY